MTDTEKAIAEVWALFKETREQMKETDKKIAQMTENVNRVSKDIDALKDKWGRFVEYILAPGIPKAFQERGIPIYRTSQRSKSTRNGETMEIDIIGVNSEYVLVVEVKSTLGVDDVKEHLETIAKFKNFFPEYKDRKVLGAVAGIEITGKADRYAYQHGLFVLGQTDDTVTILNDDKFRPKEW